MRLQFAPALLVLLLCSVFAPGHALGAQSVVPAVGQARELLNSKHYDAALNTLNQAIRLDPAYPPLWNLRAQVQIESNDPGGAIDSITRSLSINPGSAEANLILFRALLAASPEASRKHDLSLAKFMDNQDEAGMARALVFLMQNPDEAIRAPRLLKEWTPARNDRLRFAECVQSYAAGNFTGVEKGVGILRDIRPGGKELAAALAFQLGKAHLAGGDYRASLRNFQEAKTLGYDPVECDGETGWVYQAMGQPGQAVALWKTRWRESSNPGDWAMWIGDASISTKDYPTAAQFLKTALQFKPKDVGIQGKYLFALHMEGDQGALAAYEEKLRVAGGQDALRYSQALIRQVKGDLDGALAELRQIADRKPFEGVFTTFATDIAALPGSSEALDRRISIIMDIMEGSRAKPSVLSAMGWQYMTMARLDKAVMLWENAIASGLRDPQPLVFQAAQRLLEAKQPRQALEFLHRHAPKVSAFGLAYSLMRSNRFDIAEPLLKTVDPGFAAPLPELYLGLAQLRNAEPDAALRTLRKMSNGIPKPASATFACFDTTGHIVAASTGPAQAVEAYGIVAQAILEQQAADAFFFLTPPQGLPGPPDTTVARYKAEAGRMLLRTPRRAEAEEFLASALKLDPQNVNARIFNAVLRGPSTLSPQERTLFEDALAKAAPFEQAYARALLALQADNPSQATYFLKQCLQARPEDQALRMDLVTQFIALGNFDEARKTATWFEDRHAKGDRTVRAALAETKALLGDPAGAAQIWSVLLAEKPDSAGYAAGLGRARNLEEHYGEAIQAMLPAFERTGSANLASGLCEADLALGRHRDALLHAENGLIAEPDNRNLLRVAAETAERLGEPARAETHVRRLLALEPDSQSMRNALGRLLLVQHRTKEAQEYLLALLKTNPMHEPSLRGMFSLANDTGDTDAAYHYATRLKLLRPNDPGILIEYAIAAAGARDFRPAYDTLRPLRQLDANSPALTLSYPEVQDGEAPGLRRFPQWNAQVRGLHESGVNFTGLDAFSPRDNGGVPRPSRKTGLLLVGKASVRTLWKMDQTLADIGGHALLVVGADALGSDAPYAPSRSEFKKLLATGRWSLVITDDNPPPIVLPNGRPGRFWGQAMRAGGETETEAQMTSRLENRLRKLLASAGELPVRAWMYPAGQEPDNLLDVSPQERSASRKAVSSVFKIALAPNPDGFWTPATDSQLFPAFTVPAEWGVDELRAHARQKDPRSRAVLQLAKVHTWHDQLELASDLYKEAGKLGVNQAELDYNQGSNTLYQGDAPRARDLERKAVEQDPESEPKRRALKNAELMASPQATLGFQHTWDSDQRLFTRLGLGGSYYLTDKLLVSANAGAISWALNNDNRALLASAAISNPSQTNLLNYARTRSYSQLAGKDILLTARLLPWDEYFIETQGVLTATETGPAPFAGFSGTFHGPVASEGMRLNGSYDIHYAYEREDTIEAMTQGIRRHRLGVTGQARVRDFWDISLNANAMNYTDGNRVLMADGRLMYRYLEVPQLSAGYAFQYGNSDRNPPEYWAPLDLTTHLAYVTAGHTFTGLLSVNANAGYGPSKSRDHNWEGVWRAGLGAELLVWDRFRPRLRYTYFSSTTYHLNQLWLDLPYRF